MPFAYFGSSHRAFYIFVGAVSLLLPLYTWRRLIKQLRQMNKTKLFYQRHNCCVTYFKSKGFTGWPTHESDVEFSLLNGTCIYEPVLYFLRTAKFSVNIAVMILNVKAIEETLSNIAEKGVRVRLILDYDKCDLETVQRLRRSGVEVKMYVNTNEVTESMMHHKYAIKDYNGTSGFLLFGSLNWSNTGFTNNYEDIVFTTNEEAVDSFSKNFESIWSYVEDLEKNDLTACAILKNKIKIF